MRCNKSLWGAVVGVGAAGAGATFYLAHLMGEGCASTAGFFSGILHSVMKIPHVHSYMHMHLFNVSMPVDAYDVEIPGMSMFNEVTAKRLESLTDPENANTACFYFTLIGGLTITVLFSGLVGAVIKIRQLEGSVTVLEEKVDQAGTIPTALDDSSVYQSARGCCNIFRKGS